MFKLFNKIETWELLEQALGPVVAEEYNFQAYDHVLTKAIESGERIYSAAYIMPPGASLGHQRKHRNHLELLARMMRDDLPEKVASSHSMGNVFSLLKGYPTIGDFLAYQFATDLNYSELTDFSEMEFVQPGPGAIDGMRKCFSDADSFDGSDIIRWVTEAQDSEFARLGLDFADLRGRKLQLIDCQNVFCEVSKYARVAHPDAVGSHGRTRIKQRFRPRREYLTVWYPPKWGVRIDVAAHDPLVPPPGALF